MLYTRAQHGELNPHVVRRDVTNFYIRYYGVRLLDHIPKFVLSLPVSVSTDPFTSGK